ncbi:MAG: tetratricopeptide repeat protein [Candidatus Cloacimonetes bacterium]|mgnify:CR=1 FL=1|jgi:tetratricopeptide (TPR) repeat protein|nr:tetratricopeptide repeat protein [Candidatus Cloacimonadota bacterium]MDY0326178.1 tetratricopeptide repeat protein [Candidatus Cloacimonadaceae bacterium]
MMKFRLFTLVALVVLIALSACSSNKKIEVEPEPVRDPLALAREAAAEGADYYDRGMLEQAIVAFTDANTLFEEAAPMAAESDSVAYNMENMQLNVAKSHVDMAHESSSIGMHNEAINHYEAALKIYKNHKPVRISQDELNQNVLGTYNNLAITARDAGEYERALTYYDDILRLKPNDEDILNAKFFVLKDFVKDDARAFKVLEDYAEVAQDAAAYIMLAEGYAEANNYEKAEAAYMKAEKLRPDADMFTRMGNFYRANSKWENANVYLKKLADTNPEDSIKAVVYAQIGQNYSQLGNTAKMVENLEKSVNLVPNPRLSLTLAGHYNTAKNWNKVVTYSTKVLQEEANNSAARMLRGVAYYQLKNMNAAKTDLSLLVNDSTYGAQAQNILKAIK